MRKGIYKDKNGKWFIHTKVKVGDDWKTCTIRGFATKGEANQSYDNALYKWKRERLSGFNQDLIENITYDYVEFVRGGKSSRTADREQTQINTYWLDIFRYKTISDIYNKYTLEQLYNNLKNDNELNVRKKHDLVYTFLQLSNYCYIRHFINKEIYDETKIIFQPIHYVKAVEQERRVIPQCDLKAFLDIVSHENEKDYILFALLVNSGLRISELIGLCNDCFVDNKIIVKRQLLTNGKLSNKLKTAQSYRAVPISEELVNLINKYKTNNKNRFFKISHTQFKRRLYELEARANIPQYVPHEFRHSFCSHKAKLCSNIADVVYISKICGHSVNVFLNTYCNHLDNSLENKFFAD